MNVWILANKEHSVDTIKMLQADAARSLCGVIIEEFYATVREVFTAKADEAYNTWYHPFDPDAGITAVEELQDEWRAFLPKDEPMMESAWIYKRYRGIELRGIEP